MILGTLPNLVTFNAVRVEEMSIYDKNTGGPFPIPGPVFIVADTIKASELRLC